MSRVPTTVKLRVAASVALALAACGSTGHSTRAWTTLQFDGADLAVPPGWRLESWPAFGVKWKFRLYEEQERALLEITGADLSGDTYREPRAWLWWFSTQLDDRRTPLEYREYATASGTVVCAWRGRSRVFAACMRQPGAGEPQASAVVYGLNRERALFDAIGGVALLAEIAQRTRGFDYILCVRRRGELPRPGCS